jgi:hypothetical protein
MILFLGFDNLHAHKLNKENDNDKKHCKKISVVKRLQGNVPFIDHYMSIT